VRGSPQLFQTTLSTADVTADDEMIGLASV